MSKVYTIKDAAQALGIHPKTLRRWEEKGKFIPGRTLGNQRRYSDKDLTLLAKLKAGELVPEAQTRILNLEQAATKLNVSTATVQRWTKAGKLRIAVNNQLEPGYAEAEIKTLLQSPSQKIQKQPETIQETLPAQFKGSSLLFKYAGLAGLALGLGIITYLLFKPEPIVSPAVLGEQTSTVDIALPRTAQFLDGRITLGLNTGDLFFVDASGNTYIKNNALVEQMLFTRSLQLLPSTPPNENQIGQMFVDQESGNLKYFDGLEWINLNHSASTSAENSWNSSITSEDQDIDLTLGNANASASAASLRLTLAGDQSVFKVLGGAGQDILTLNDDALTPITLSQPTQILGNLSAPKLIDQDQNSYFLDPSSTTLSLSVAGEASISASLYFTRYGDSLSNSVDDYLVLSGGLGLGGGTSYGFSPDQKLNIRSASIDNSLTVSGDVHITGDIITDSTTYPDYVFEPDYNLLSPLELKEFITSQRHLPGVPSLAQVNNEGLNIKGLLLAILEKTEENTLYILDLYDKNSRIITPTVATEILTTNMISPLADNPIVIDGDASVSGTLYAKEIDSSTIDRLREKISELAGSLTSSPNPEPMPIATQAAILDSLPPATDSGHLALTSIEADAAFFKDYLAVLGQTTLTDLTINGSLNVHSILAGLIVLDESGTVTINGRLETQSLQVTGPLTASQINPLPDQELAINIASGSALSIYSSINPLATFSGQTVSLANLKLEASGTATISAGANNSPVATGRLTEQSQVIITFTSDYTPATKYWVKKDSGAGRFTVFTNYPVNNDTTLDWLIIN